ncbi:MAG TPA: CopD family protein [Flavobacteriales bacterium]|nr:CopD family protein [Flavobacteriales bacterium]HIA13197.1 CopD family protein [Flavobacteriales bacterium]
MLPYYIKALHLIFVVTWFAGLFYIVRLFIYQVEAEDKPENEKLILQTQFKLMQKRLWYGITVPSAFGTLIFGFWLAELNNLWDSGWFHLKLGFVLGLLLYHFQCGRIFKQLQNDDIKLSSSKLRIWNEVATLLLVSIVFIATLKNSMDWIWGTVGFFSLAIVLMLAIKMYKRFR